MTNNPTDIRAREVHITLVDVVDVLHRPGSSNSSATVVSHDTLRLASRTGSVQNVQRVVTFYGNTRLVNSGVLHRLMIVEVLSLLER